MQARGPLMVEHRWIERMIALLRRQLEHIETSNEADPVFIDTAVDFIRMYADRTHHGKEEDIYFRDLSKKRLNEHDRQLMEELIEEHRFGRRTTRELVEANARYRTGDSSALAVIAEKLRTLVEFYPKHILKEDRDFFPAALLYVTQEEDQAMLAEFWECDRHMIHEKYREVVQQLAQG